MRLWPRSSPEGHREISEEEARRIAREGRARHYASRDPFVVGFDEGARGGAESREAIEESIRFFEERRDQCRRDGFESGALAAEGIIAGKRSKLRALPEPEGATGVVGPGGEWLGGPTGAVPIIERVESKGKPDEIRTGYGTTVGVTGTHPGFVGFKDGEWYAFRIYRQPGAYSAVIEFFAVATVDTTTGFLELREIPDPWLCRECGLGYQEGAHTEFGFTGPDAHDYVARGAPGEEPES